MCNGQTLSIAQNAALFALLGTTYGGNGQTTFQLPNLQGRSMVHWGTGQGLTTLVIGEQAGNETVSVAIGNMPSHTHTFSSTSTFSASGPQPHATLNVPAAGAVLGHAVDIAHPPHISAGSLGPQRHGDVCRTRRLERGRHS